MPFEFNYSMNATSTALFEKFSKLKTSAGNHSPSLTTLKAKMPEIEIKVDACFLSNPYATELFLKYFKKELLDSGEINNVLEFYPSQNNEIAALVGEHLQVDPDRIFIGNGATEVVQAIIHHFVKDKLIVNIPTFSPYYSFALPHTEVVFYELKKEENLSLI